MRYFKWKLEATAFAVASGKSNANIQKLKNILRRHVFFISEHFLLENEPQSFKNLKKVLRKPQASNAWAAILKTLIFPLAV